MAIRQSPVPRALTGSLFAALSGCSEPPKCEAFGPNDFQVGRYKIVTIAGTREVIEVDSATGKTWRLEWSDSNEGLVSYAWESLDD